jgi:hypothetical protein
VKKDGNHEIEALSFQRDPDDGKRFRILNTGLFSLFRMAASNMIIGRTFLLFNGNEMRSKLFYLGNQSVCDDGPCLKGPCSVVRCVASRL